MKNKSWKYPFGTFADKMFDKNRDGKLDSFETMFRDMHIDEMNKKMYEKQSSSINTKPKNTYCDFEQKNSKNKASDGTTIFVSLLIVLILVVAVFLIINIDSALINLLILFGAIAVCTFILKTTGLS